MNVIPAGTPCVIVGASRTGQLCTVVEILAHAPVFYSQARYGIETIYVVELASAACNFKGVNRWAARREDLAPIGPPHRAPATLP